MGGPAAVAGCIMVGVPGGWCWSDLCWGMLGTGGSRKEFMRTKTVNALTPERDKEIQRVRRDKGKQRLFSPLPGL